MMNFRNTQKRKAVGLLMTGFVLALSVNFAVGSEPRDLDAKPPRGDARRDQKLGGEIPVPYKTANLRTELADGEYYVLQGKVVYRGGKPYFQVDLNVHPWLANQRRLANPFYPLDRDSADWDNFAGSRIQVTLQAGARITDPARTGGVPYSYIGLKAMEEPKLIGY
ncbi:MAG: hypothetical protein AB7P04_12550 [Bacteriovoracia bacterium]